MRRILHHELHEFAREPQAQSAKHLVEWNTVRTSSASGYVHKKTHCTNGDQNQYRNIRYEYDCEGFNYKGTTVAIQKNWLPYADVTRVKWLLTHHIPSRMGIDCASIEFRDRNFPLTVITVTTYSRCTLRSPWQSAERSIQKAQTTVTGNGMVHRKIMPATCECFRKRCVAIYAVIILGTMQRLGVSSPQYNDSVIMSVSVIRYMASGPAETARLRCRWWAVSMAPKREGKLYEHIL
jgi:hypothetical protein